MAPAIKHAPTIDISVARTMTVVLLPELDCESSDPSPLSSEEAALLADAIPVDSVAALLTAEVGLDDVGTV